MAEGGSSGGGYGDALFIIGIIILLFVMWVATGGPQKPISSGGFALTSPQPLGTGEATGNSALLGYRAPIGIPQGPGIPRPSPSATQEREEQAQTGTTPDTSERSSYRGTVTLTRSTSALKKTNPKEEYIRISVSRRAEDPIILSGWKLVSAVTEKNASIPLGTELPLSGLITPTEAITLNPGEYAYVITGRSPIGTSFKTNLCVGYYGQYQNFTPSLRNSCPYADDELAEFATGINSDRDPSCELFAEDIPRCSIVTDIPPYLSSSCSSFLENNINYNGCVRNHQNDDNFFSNEWRIYLGRSAELWKQERETIRLYDSEGKLVDQISY